MYFAFELKYFRKEKKMHLKVGCYTYAIVGCVCFLSLERAKCTTFLETIQYLLSTTIIQPTFPRFNDRHKSNIP